MRWLETCLSAVLLTSDSGVWGDEDPDNGISVLRSTNIESDGTIDFSNLTIRSIPTDKRDAKLLAPGDIILENSGGGPKQPVGRVCYFQGDNRNHVVGNFCRRLRANLDVIVPRYLFWSLFYAHASGETLRFQTQTTGIRNLQFQAYARQPFALPPLSEQHRIVEILNEADRLRQLRREADAKAARILPALFLKMFGDPATNPRGWDMTTVGDIVRATDYGTSTRASDNGSGIPLIRMGNVDYNGHLDLRDLKHVQLSDSEVARFRLQQGDILFNRTNSKELVGKTGLWDADIDAVSASYFIRVRLDQKQVMPTFFWAFMNCSYMKKILLATARGAIGQANINSSELRAMVIYKPPLDQQYLFTNRWKQIRATIPQRIGDQTDLDNLFSTLLQSAFSGQLTAKWREAHGKELLAEMEQQARLLNLPLPKELEITP